MKKFWPLLLIAALFFANRFFGEPVKIPWRLTEPQATTVDTTEPRAGGEAAGGVRQWQSAPQQMIETNRSTGGGAPSAGKMMGSVNRGLNKK